MATPDPRRGDEPDVPQPDVPQPDNEKQPKPDHELAQDDDLQAGQYGPNSRRD